MWLTSRKHFGHLFNFQDFLEGYCSKHVLSRGLLLKTWRKLYLDSPREKFISCFQFANKLNFLYLAWFYWFSSYWISFEFVKEIATAAFVMKAILPVSHTREYGPSIGRSIKQFPKTIFKRTSAFVGKNISRTFSVASYIVNVKSNIRKKEKKNLSFELIPYRKAYSTFRLCK